MNKKYTVLPKPYYTDDADGLRYYDLAISAGDVVGANLTRLDPQGDVYASSVADYSGDWISPECLEEIKDWQDYTPDGLTPVEGDEVIGKLFYQNDEIVKGIVETITVVGGIRITVTEGPEGNIGDLNREVYRTRILKSSGPNAPRSEYVPTPEPLTAPDGQFVLILTESELDEVILQTSGCYDAPGTTVHAKAKTLLPKPKTVTLDSREARLIAQAFKESTLGGVDYWPILEKLGL